MFAYKIFKVILNFSLYLIAFFIMHYFHKGSFYLDKKYFGYLIYFFISFILSILISRKFRSNSDKSIYSVIRPFIIAFFLLLGLVTFITHYLNHNYSRVIVSGSLLTAFFIEIITIVVKNKKNVNIKSIKGLIKSGTTFGIEILSFSWILFFTIFFKMDLAKPPEYYFLLVIATYVIWFSSSIMTHNFPNLNIRQNHIHVLWNYFSGNLLIISLVMFLLFLLDIKTTNKIVYITGMIIYAFWSIGVLLLRYLYYVPKSTDEVSPNIFSAPTIEFEDDGLYKDYFIAPPQKYEVNPTAPHDTTVREKLENIYLKSLPTIFTFIDKFICLKRINILKSLVIRSADPYNIEVLPHNSFDLLINLHEMNDIRRLNQYFIDVNKRLVSGGVFVSVFEPVRFRHKRFHDKYPFFIAKFLYFLDFIWRRAIPKLPVLKKIYFSLTKGRDRAISMAECFGRLYYCGFEIIETLVEENKLYFIVKKIKEPSTDSNPSYGPFFKMKRIGKDGKLIFVYKLRTMHPYSEYLQKFMFENYGSTSGDKVDNDFRITYWGKLLRRIWFDELPMLINWFNGDLKIVGVRPLSVHKFGMYPEWLQKKRVKVKPGLVPPYYAHMPKNFDELVASENKYLEDYFKSPLKTDFIYFFKAFYNIIFKNARSS